MPDQVGQDREAAGEASKSALDDGVVCGGGCGIKCMSDCDESCSLDNIPADARNGAMAERTRTVQKRKKTMVKVRAGLHAYHARLTFTASL